MVLMVALIAILSVTAGTIQEVIEKGTNAQNHFFEQQFLLELTTQCQLLAHVGNGSILRVNGFSPQEWIIQSEGDFLQLNDQNVFCPTHSIMPEKKVNGSFELYLTKNS